ncbi:acyltransferase family protein [Caenimonas koreensis DSM 17982]|uniref:Acyltransferase family protein n=1 Tax=Caenimonas koreensis DSM 17982 TaxID=1121255 RepID=A0A844B251_9BURK|nr:acyltransferase [Caenimonas koreensis]MRD47273.1 acyltransferase family protein [Caenimonas koreensis DSM 17982]
MWALDSGRLVAACFVLAGHLSLYFGGPLWVSVAPAGLSWFFVLSGFILATIYHDVELRAPTLRQFYLRRFVRIYPLYLLACVFGVVVLWIGNPSMTRQGLAALGIPGFSSFDLPENLGNGYLLAVFAKTLAFISPFDAHTTARYLVNSPLWSIYCEVFFYALLPLLVITLRRITSPAMLWVTAALLWLLEGAIILVVTNGQLGEAADWSLVHASLYTNPLARLPEFMIGISLALARQRNVWRPSRRVIWVGVASCLGVLNFSLLLGSLPQLQPLGLYWLVVPANAVSIALLASLPKTSPRIESASVALGLLSYAIYALHWPMLELAYLLQSRYLLPVPLLIIGTAAAVIVVGWLVVRWYETPARKQLHALFNSPSARVPTT